METKRKNMFFLPVLALLVMNCELTFPQNLNIDSTLDLETSDIDSGMSFRQSIAVPYPGAALARDLARRSTTKDISQFGDLSLMEWMQGLMNLYTWQPENFEKVGEKCVNEISSYLSNLRNGSSWAVKMYDATGRYNSQFFFGNDFWVGSKTLCTELTNINTNLAVPPFPVKFSVAKMQIYLNEYLTPKARLMTVGLCLPLSCKAQDMFLLLQDTTRAQGHVGNSVSARIVSVRPVPGDYQMIYDVKFQIIFGFFSAVLILIIIATGFESYLNNRRENNIDCELDSMDRTSTPTPDNLQVKSNGYRAVSLAHNGNGIAKTGIDSKKGQHLHRHPGKDLAAKLLLCFSALTNGRKILNMEVNEENLAFLHGLKFYSLIWVILVHTCLQAFSIAENKTFRTLTERDFFYQTIPNATFSVDTFFFISGLLLTILYLRSLKTNKEQQTAHSEENKKPCVVQEVKTNTTKFMVLIFYRFIRLSPAYLFILGITEVSLRAAHNSAVFEPDFWDHITCAKYWWRNILYINSLYPQREMCMLWSWYLSNDTQFYVLGVILLLISVKHFRVAAVSFFLILASSWVTTFSIAYIYEYRARVEEPFALFDQLYDKPWSRIGPYLVGMATGWILSKLDGKPKIPHAWCVTGWILSLSCMCSLVYGLGTDGLNVPTSSVYVSLGHTAWGLALSWLTIACATGHGGPIKSLLSWKCLFPLSRLTYCAYLVHPMIMAVTKAKLDGPVHIHSYLVVTIFFGNVFISLILSFIISLAFEAPIVQLLKVMMSGYRKKN